MCRKFFAVALVLVLLPTLCGLHICDGDHCAVCAVLITLRCAVSAAVVLMIAHILCVRAVTRRRDGMCRAAATPISEKVKLTD